MTLARLSVQTNAQVEIGLDNRTIFWYNIHMTSENSNISDSLSRINLETESHNKGFTMTFPNRVTVSVRWGSFNYSDGKTNAECAAWDADTHEWVHVPEFDYSGDDVLARMETHEIARFMYNACMMISSSSNA